MWNRKWLYILGSKRAGECDSLAFLPSSITSTSHALLTFLPCRWTEWPADLIGFASLGGACLRAKPHYDVFRPVSRLRAGHEAWWSAATPRGIIKLLESRVGLAATERIEESEVF